MTSIRKAALAAITLFAVFLLASCGDTIRAIATPIIKPGGDPSQFHHAQIISNPSGADGFVTHIDISGDTNAGQVPVGRNPVHLTAINAGTRTYVVNQGDATLSVYSTFTPLSAAPTTITMPLGSQPSFIAGSSNNLLYVTLTANNSVGVIDSTLNLFSAEIPVGQAPVAVGFNGDGSKAFVVNRDSNTVSVITTIDRQVVDTITVGSTPVYLAMSTDGGFAYVVNQASNNVSVINTSDDTVQTVTVGSGPNFAFFDSQRLRLYVTNQAGNSLSVISANPQASTFLSVTNVAVGTAPTSVAALPDGTRVYVANSGSNTVSIVNALSNTVQKTVTVGITPISLGASPDSTKVVVANQGSNNASIIRTSDDTVAATLPLPSNPIRVIMSR